MKVSVIVPVYNVEKYIEKCLDTIVNQMFDDYEVIVIIDGSTDNSEKIARTYQERYPKIVKIICQENRGLGGARNTGIRNAMGEYLLFVDSDDMLCPATLSDVYEKAVSDDADVVVFDMDFVDECEHVIKSEKAIFGEHDLIDFDMKSRILAWPSAWNKLYRRTLFLENEILYPERLWYEDLATTPKVLMSAKKITYIAKPYYKYVQRVGSIMNSKKVERNLEIIQAFEMIVHYARKKGIYEMVGEEIEFLAIYHILYTAVVRVNKIDSSNKIQHTLVDYVQENYPQYRYNTYLKRLMSKKEKLVISIIGAKQFRMLNIIFKIKSNMAIK